MTTIEIILLIVGMLFLLGSFWVTEKLSPNELEHISELSKEEMGVMLEHELERSRQKVTDIVEETIDASKERTERALEKQTNEKIMAIDEYSDTVIEKINKTHNEIMFLYSMLNDKHTELTDFSNGISQQIDGFKVQADEISDTCLEQLKQQAQLYALQTAQQTQQYVAAPPVSVSPAGRTLAASSQQSGQPAAAQQADLATAAAAHKAGQAVAATVQEQIVTGEGSLGQQESEAEQVPNGTGEEEKQVNVKDEIFKLYEEGKDSVAIAKKLGMGVGEVRLILGLYKGEHVSEV